MYRRLALLAPLTAVLLACSPTSTPTSPTGGATGLREVRIPSAIADYVGIDASQYPPGAQVVFENPASESCNLVMEKTITPQAETYTEVPGSRACFGRLDPPAVRSTNPVPLGSGRRFLVPGVVQADGRTTPTFGDFTDIAIRW